MAEPTLYRDNASPQGILENVQEMLIERFGKSPKPIEPIMYEFTDDKALLHQYYILRERMLGTEKFFKKNELPQDIHDKISLTLIARRERQCLGGARLTIREGDETFSLPMETDDFRLRDLFPHLPLDKERHAVGSKFAILDYEKDFEVLYTMCKIMYQKVVDLEVSYYFVRATNMTLARNWRKIFNTMRPNSTRICTEIDVPDSPFYPNQKQYLVFSDMTGAAAKAPMKETKIYEPRLSLVE